MHKRDIMACDFLMWFLVGKNCDWIIPVVSARFSTENFCSGGLNLIIGASHDEGCNYGGRSSCWLPLRKDRPRMLNHAWHEESKLPYPTKAENDKAWRLANHTASPAAAASTTSAKTFEGFWEQMPTNQNPSERKVLLSPAHSHHHWRLALQGSHPQGNRFPKMRHPQLHHSNMHLGNPVAAP